MRLKDFISWSTLSMNSTDLDSQTPWLYYMNYMKEDHRNYRRNFCSCEKKAEKKFRLFRDSNYIIPYPAVLIQLFRERLSEKGHATMSKRYCGWFWVFCSSKKFGRMAREAIEVCLPVLMESNKRRRDSYSVRNSVLIISHYLSGLSGAHFFPTTFLETAVHDFHIFITLSSSPHWFNPGRTRKFITPPWYKGEGVDGTPPQSFWYVAAFRNDFAFSGKPLIFLTRWGIFYGWWRCWRPVTSTIMVAILAAILDFTKN